jgi:tetratricopeptide (TPR) repeat protein
MDISFITPISNETKVVASETIQKPKAEPSIAETSCRRGSWKKHASESSIYFREDSETIAMELAGKAFSLWERNEFEKSITYLTRAIDLLKKTNPLSPVLLSLYHARACSYIETEKYALAILDFDAALLLPSSFEHPYDYNSKTHLLRERALASLANGEPEEVYLEDINQAAKEGDLIAALLLKREENTTPFSPPIDAEFEDLEYAEKLFADRRYTLAIEELTKFIDALKDADTIIISGTPYTRALALRGACFALLKKNAEALADFENSIIHEIDDYDLLEYLNARAVLNLSLGNKQAAKFDLTVARQERLMDSTSNLLWKLFL